MIDMVNRINTLEIEKSTLTSIYAGMKAVTKGAEGSARTVFEGFPIEVAGKTGTAEGWKV